jgi:hypothetical protein
VRDPKVVLEGWYFTGCFVPNAGGGPMTDEQLFDAALEVLADLVLRAIRIRLQREMLEKSIAESGTTA